MDKFQKLSNTINAGAKSTLQGKEVIDIALNKIAPRYTNLYIRNDERLKPLISTIKSEGFSVPINVLPIDQAIKLNETSNEEKEYLENEKIAGKEYVIISGHRRFYSCCFIAMQAHCPEFNPEYDIRSQITLLCESLYENVESEITELEALGMLSSEPETLAKAKLLYIKCVVEHDDLNKESEAVRHIKENLARENTTTFEIVANVYKFVSDFNLEGELFSKYGQDGTTSFINVLSRYLLDEYGFDITVSSITKIIDILKVFPQEVINKIFDGTLSFRNVKTVLPIYKKLDENRKERAVTFLVGGSWEDVLKMKDEPKKRNIKDKQFNQSKVLDILNKVKEGKLTIDQAIQQFS